MISGTLYVVATPIGNLEDITLRALRVLKEVDLIAAEDTRHSRKLLTHYGISKPLTSYFDHNKQIKGTYILQRLREGQSVALITDAGTPCISDPGYQLVRDAWAAGIAVVPIPGPSAVVAALSASGLPTDSFTFAGFLPNRQSKRREKFERLSHESRVVIFYEAPQRLQASLEDLLLVCGDRDVVVSREITKIHEEFLRGKASEVTARLSGRTVKGEVAILMSPAAEPPHEEFRQDATGILKRLLAEGASLKDAARLAAATTGLSRTELYAAALVIKGEGKNIG